MVVGRRTDHTAAFSESTLGPSGSQLTGLTLTEENRDLVMVQLWTPPISQQRCSTIGSPASAFRGARWVDGFPLYSAYYHWLPPTSEVPDCGVVQPLRALWMPPRSRHPGGVNLLLCDGSVRFIGETVDLQTWHALGSRNHGEVIGEF